MSFEVNINEQGTHPVITLRDLATGSEAEIYAFGGLLNGFRAVINGLAVNLVDGFISVDDAQENMSDGFKSAKLSPFVCRMRKGTYAFDGKTYRVQKHYLGEHAIHGLLYDSIFSITGTRSDATNAGVTLERLYTGSDAGFPFQYHMRIEWMLETGNRLTATTTVVHQNKEPIPFADGWHPYFTLGDDTIDGCILQFNSSTQLEYDDALLPTGRKLTDNRFQKGSLLQNTSLDNSFELDGMGKPASCTLRNARIRLTIEPDGSYPILQVYTPAHRKSIAIENLSGAPDNFNNKIGLLLLPPGEPKTFITRYTAGSL